MFKSQSEHLCKITLKLAYWFRWCHLKKLLTTYDRRHKTDDGHRPITVAHLEHLVISWVKKLGWSPSWNAVLSPSHKHGCAGFSAVCTSQMGTVYTGLDIHCSFASASLSWPCGYANVMLPLLFANWIMRWMHKRPWRIDILGLHCSHKPHLFQSLLFANLKDWKDYMACQSGLGLRYWGMLYANCAGWSTFTDILILFL